MVYVIISSHGDRTRNNYTNEKVVFKLYFHIPATDIPGAACTLDYSVLSYFFTL